MFKNKAVIWDLDGTLIDSEPLQIKAYKESFSKFGIDINEDDYRKNMGRKDIFERIILKYNKKCDYDRWYEEKTKIYRKEIEKKIRLLPRVKDLLEDVKVEGYKMGIASSTSKKSLLFILNKLKIRNYFQGFISGDDVINSKPDPEPYIRIAEKLNVKPKNCVVFEDLEIGVKSAKGAGMKCIAVTQTNRIKQNFKMADLVINNFDSFKIGNLEKIWKN